MAVAAVPADPPLTAQRAARDAPRRRPHRSTTAAWIAFFLGLGYAGVSVYWGLGGTGLLDTVGGSLEHAGRQGGPAISLTLWAVATLKVAAAVLPLLAVGRRNDASWQRTVRALSCAEAAILTGYGFVMTAVGLLVQAGLVPTGARANGRALAWHAFLWDPWFMVWGVAVCAALWRSASGRPPARRGYSDGRKCM